jgi:hypothetical protein
MRAHHMETLPAPLSVRLRDVNGAPVENPKHEIAGPERGQDFEQNKDLILRFPTNYAI